MVLAFVEGYAWRSGRHVEVRLLAEDASEWAMVGGDVAEMRAQAREIVMEVLRDQRMRLTRGLFQVWAHA